MNLGSRGGHQLLVPQYNVVFVLVESDAKIPAEYLGWTHRLGLEVRDLWLPD